MGGGDSIVGVKSKAFAIRIIKLYGYLNEQFKIYPIAKQILRSGTAAGALISEAKYAESDADFIHKLKIAMKEANETNYWLELLKSAGYITPKEFNSINKDIVELLKLLTSIINTSKKKLGKV
jgi:four helix bundle protein